MAAANGDQEPGFVILNVVKNLNLCQQEAYRLRRNGTSHVPYEKMAFAGTNVSPYENS
jgi:hypothetical protein